MTWSETKQANTPLESLDEALSQIRSDERTKVMQALEKIVSDVHSYVSVIDDNLKAVKTSEKKEGPEPTPNLSAAQNYTKILKREVSKVHRYLLDRILHYD